MKNDSDLLAGFFSALESFAQETTESSIKSVIVKNLKFSYLKFCKNDLQINCQTCKKVIIDDYIPKIIDGNRKIYFCCSSCEKMFSLESQLN